MCCFAFMVGIIYLVGVAGFVGLAVGFVGCALDAFLWFGRVALRGFGF